MQRPGYSMFDATSWGVGILRPELSGCCKGRAQTHPFSFDHNATAAFRKRDRSEIFRLIWGFARFGQPSYPGIRPEVMKFARAPP